MHHCMSATLNISMWVVLMPLCNDAFTPAIGMSYNIKLKLACAGTDEERRVQRCSSVCLHVNVVRA